MGCEDYILENLVEYLLQYSKGHMSLHYDGVRAQRDTMSSIARATSPDEYASGISDAQVFLRECEQYVQDATGYHVEFAIKNHRYFQNWVPSGPAGDAPHLHDIFYKLGNCIGL
eukprot:5760325-Pyramimonas_sp.AAC.1